jgi:hypothetical protein
MNTLCLRDPAFIVSEEDVVVSQPPSGSIDNFRVTENGLVSGLDSLVLRGVPAHTTCRPTPQQ